MIRPHIVPALDRQPDPPVTPRRQLPQRQPDRVQLVIARPMQSRSPQRISDRRNREPIPLQIDRSPRSLQRSHHDPADSARAHDRSHPLLRHPRRRQPKLLQPKTQLLRPLPSPITKILHRAVCAPLPTLRLRIRGMRNEIRDRIQRLPWSPKPEIRHQRRNHRIRPIPQTLRHHQNPPPRLLRHPFIVPQRPRNSHHRNSRQFRHRPH